MAKEIAELRLTANASPGAAAIRVFSPPEVRLSLLFLSCHGLVMGISRYLYLKGLISADFKNIYITSEYIFMLGGTLVILGKFSLARLAALLTVSAAVQLWQYYFKLHESPLLGVSFFIALAPLFYWLWKEPETAALLGMKKSQLLKDVCIGAALGGILLVYLFAFAHIYDFTLKVEPAKIIVHGMTVFPDNLISFIFVFALWNRVNERGVSPLGNIVVLFTVIIAISAPINLAYAFAGAVSGVKNLAGFSSMLFVFLLLFYISLRNLKSTVPVAIVVVTLQEMLVMAGIL